MSWLRTASGGQVNGARVVCLEVEPRRGDRWVIEAHTDDGSVWELSGEFPTRGVAAARATDLARRIDYGD